jgi:hypothetical protein
MRKPRADLEQQLEKYRCELAEAQDHLAEALEQQTATSEVLQVISGSLGELEPVFQAILANATRLCAAKFGVLWLVEGDAFRAVALRHLRSLRSGAANRWCDPVRDNNLLAWHAPRMLCISPTS